MTSLRVLAAAVAVVAAAAAGCSSGPAATDGPGPNDGPNLATPSVAGGPVTSLAALAPADPVELKIETIGATSSLIPLGLNPDQTISVPPVSQPMQASWYRFGPQPGTPGPAVILGHVNGNGQPGIFARLHETKPGDQVKISRNDGSTAIFTITRLEQIAKGSFPTEAIYGDVGGNASELRLITCGGTFDGNARSYRDNIIAFATLTAVA